MTAFEFRISPQQFKALKIGATAVDGYCPGRLSVQSALRRRGLVGDDYRITEFGRAVVRRTETE